MFNSFLRVTSLVKEILKSVVNVGDISIDATAGTGEDTLILKKLTGEKGWVYAFDVQEKALKLTEEKLEDHGLNTHVRLINDNHENMENVLKNYGVKPGTVKAITFNLGYLPGGDHEIVTESTSTIKALESGLEFLCVQGVMTICLYHGHSRGAFEAEKVLEWCKEIDRSFIVHHFETLNRKTPPTLVIIQKRK